MTILFEVITIAPLVFALVLLQRERHRFATLTPFVVGIPFIALARAAEVCMKFRIGPLSTSESNELLLNTISDLSDVIGIALLVIGFVVTVRFQHKAAAAIERLEELLPICAACKKYRTEDGAWKPIEEFVTTRGGASGVTHGYCPECADKLMADCERYAEGRKRRDDRRRL
jgi:hypothetical protein